VPHIALPGIGPTDVLDEFSRLPERKIDTRDPWARPSQCILKSIEIPPFIEFARIQLIAVESAYETGDGLTSIWGAREVNAVDFHVQTMA
jgi:hypothetical protein